MPHGQPHRLNPLAGLSYEQLLAMGLVGPPPIVPPTTGAVLGQNQPGGVGPGVVSTPGQSFAPPLPMTRIPAPNTGVIQRSRGTIPRPVLGDDGITDDAVRHTKATTAAPRRPEPVAAAAGGGEESVLQNPNFWLAAASAAAPVLGAMFQPRKPGAVPNVSGPSAGGAAQGQIQSIMGGTPLANPFLR